MKKLFKKVFKKMKKIFKPIGRELKRGLKSVGKAFGKLGPIGTLALSLMLPGAGTVLGSLGNVVSNVAASAPFSGTIFGPVGKVIQGVAKVAQAGGKVYSSISEFVGNTVNGLTGGSFKGEMIPKVDAAGNPVLDEAGKKILVKNTAYQKGAARNFGDWVSNKLDNTRRAFGLETSMDEKGLEQSLQSNEKALTGVNDVNTKIPTAVKPTVSPSAMNETTTSNRVLTDDELFAQAEQKSLLSTTPMPEQKTYLEMYPERETIEVPVGYEKTQSETLGKFATDTTPYEKYNLKTKTIFKDQLSPEDFEKLNIDDTNYFADFNNNRISKAETFINTNYKKDGKFLEEFDSLTSADLDRQMLRQDAAAIAKPAALIGGILSPDTPESTGGGSSGYVAPLPTSTDITRYQGSVEQTYRDLGYKGPNTMAGYHMMGAYGNTPINFLQGRQTMQVPQPITQMPSF